ncbi:MAG: class I SAM-dependent methyltransferase [Saprospiraceae bacterium]|nr:class I SAM-dependent methyltransferase [Saprospiraceae bacterium]
MMREFWDERYSREDYVYGENPNAFFAQQIEKIVPGRILLPAEGEGRNAVYAATLGWQVDAFDISKAGRHKADKLAAANGVSIDYRISTLQQAAYDKHSFNALALIFAHFPLQVRMEYFPRLLQTLQPGATIILECFSKDQLLFSSKNPRAGGPKDKDLLYSKEEIKQLFADVEVMHLVETEVDLAEGDFHVGRSSVIQFVGKLP